MIEPGDLGRPAQVRVQIGERRDWLLRKRPVFRVVFAGFIEQVDYDMRGSRFLLVDAMTRLAKAQLQTPLTDDEYEALKADWLAKHGRGVST